MYTIKTFSNDTELLNYLNNGVCKVIKYFSDRKVLVTEKEILPDNETVISIAEGSDGENITETVKYKDGHEVKTVNEKVV